MNIWRILEIEKPLIATHHRSLCGQSASKSAISILFCGTMYPFSFVEIANDLSDHSIVISDIYLPIKPEAQTVTKHYTDFELFRMNLIENFSNETNYLSDVNSYSIYITESITTALNG